MDRSHVFEAALVILIIGLCGLLYLAITSPASPAAGSWEIAGNGSVDYMLVGTDDTLYAFSGNNITAIRSDGDVAWTLAVPPEWKVLNSWEMPVYSTPSEGSSAGFWSTPIADERGGYLYLYVTHAITQADIDSANDDPDLTAIDYPAKLLAISPEGKVAWEYDVPGDIPASNVRWYMNASFITMPDIAVVQAAGDREYLFHDDSEDVLDENGGLLFTISNVSAPVSVGPDGRIYSVRTASGSAGASTPVSGSNTTIGTPVSSIVDAYDSGGRLLWSRDVGEPVIREPMIDGVWQQYNKLPIYLNDTLYVPVANGVAALDTDGRLRWVSHVPGNDSYVLYDLMPADAPGNVYMSKLSESGDWYTSALYTISPDGNVSSRPWDFVRDAYNGNYVQAVYPVPLAGKDGIVYAYQPFGPITFRAFNDTVHTLRYGMDTIEAIDVKTNRTLWNFTVPDEDKHVLTLNGSNVKSAIRWASPASVDADTLRYETDSGWAAEYCHFLPQITDRTKVYPGSRVTYVSYDFAMYEAPVIGNMSRCIYARGIYALDSQGHVLWEKQFDDYVDRAAAGNGFIYYLTSGGRLGGGGAGIAAGFAIAAVAYLFLRFFMVGTVARARGRLEQNANRRRVLQYVEDNPGVTVVDVVKGLGVNMGTTRYHLFVLTMNHKIITHREDDKYTRYFRNAGSYSPAERTLVSLLRREPLRRTLRALTEKPGLSGQGLAQELDVSATAANRYIALLAGRGIIGPVPGDERGRGYAISPEYGEMVGRLMGRI